MGGIENVDVGVGKEGALFTASEVQIRAASMRIREEFPQIDLLYDPAIPFLGTYPKDSISYYRDTCSPMFTAAVFTIPRKWKQPGCPLTDKWIMKMWLIYTMEYFSTVNKKMKL